MPGPDGFPNATRHVFGQVLIELIGVDQPVLTQFLGGESDPAQRRLIEGAAVEDEHQPVRLGMTCWDPVDTH